MSDETRALDAVGVGDELQIVGLFTHHRGTRRNVPIARSGIISAMPDPNEPVITNLGPMEAYLAEVRSLGGLSGSPVVVVLPPGRKKVTAPVHLFTSHLLGLVHGHRDEPVTAGEYAETAEREKINQGIAVIVPSSRILEVLDAPEERAKRQRAFEAHRTL